PWKTYYKFQDTYNDVMRQTAQNSKIRLVDAAGANWWQQEHFYDHVHKRPDANRKIAKMVMQEVILAASQSNN
ncbi:hypothetical protein K8T06_07875, partial [bacterium]|nr:hypothetical protein [bacterium]